MGATRLARATSSKVNAPSVLLKHHCAAAAPARGALDSQ
jgi:hypothetical protein